MEHCTPHTKAVHTAMFPEREVAGRELVAASCSSSRWFSYVLWLKVQSHRLQRAYLLDSKRCYHLQFVRSDFPLWSAVQGACSFLAPCTSVIRVLCQVLEPTAFLVHLVLAPLAEDGVASTPVRQIETRLNSAGVQAYTTDHDLCLSCIYSQPFLLHYFLPSQEPPDTFLERVSDNKVIGMEVLQGDLRAELACQGFKHNDEEQWAEYRALVNIDLHFKLFYCTPHQYGHRSTHWPSRTIHSTTPSFLSAHQMTF